MYVMKADGQVFYAPTMPQDKYQVLTPNAKLEVNAAGSLTFILPPGHVMRDNIHRMKSIITVEQDGEEIFRGRVSEENTDIYNQKECYCEGDLSFLMDSVQKPYTFNGAAKDLFQQLINTHNEQVDEERRFTVGLMTALSDDDTVEMESVNYDDTLGEIKFVLVNDFGGHLRTRYENGVRYIDYVDEDSEECAQKIEFGVNMLDLDDQIDSKNICTVLIPLGKGDGSSPLTIASVNNGLDYIESAEGIAKYRRIVKTKTWDDVEDPAELLKLGQEWLDKMAVVQTLTLKAIDLHLLNVDVDKIKIGSKVHLVSKPHGLDKVDICTAIDIDMENPENTTYTFGEPGETLSDGMNAHSRAIDRSSSENSYRHNHTLQYLDEVNNRLHTVEFDMNAVESTILLKADATDLDELSGRVSSAEISLDGLNAEIELKVNKDGVVSAINMSPEGVKIAASKIELDGETIVSKLSGSHLDVYSIYGSEGDFSLLYAGSGDIGTLNCDSLVVGGNDAGWQSVEVLTSIGGRGVTGEYKTIQYLNWDGAKASTSVMTGFSQAAFSTDKATVNYIGSAPVT